MPTVVPSEPAAVRALANPIVARANALAGDADTAFVAFWRRPPELARCTRGQSDGRPGRTVPANCAVYQTIYYTAQPVNASKAASNRGRNNISRVTWRRFVRSGQAISAKQRAAWFINWSKASDAW